MFSFRRFEFYLFDFNCVEYYRYPVSFNAIIKRNSPSSLATQVYNQYLLILIDSKMKRERFLQITLFALHSPHCDRT